MATMIDEAIQTDPILVVTGPEGRLRDQFVGLVTFIGRSPDADLCLSAPEVDELHCLIAQSTAGLVLKDCFTGAGTFLNGERVSETLLNSGDELVVGPYHLTLRVPESQSSGAAAHDAQRELIQQMAKRLAGLEGKRRAALRRAWQGRRKGAAGQANAGVQRGPTPFGSADQSKVNALEAQLAAEKRRSAALEAERATARPASGTGQEGLRCSEIGQSNEDGAEKGGRSEDQEALESLRDYEKQLNEFRDQLSKDAEDLQKRETDAAQRAEELRIAEGLLQTKIADTEKELAGERARVKREQTQLERMTAECRQDLEEMQRDTENLERDEKFQRLRSQIRDHRDEQDTLEPVRLSERIHRFLKGLGG